VGCGKRHATRVFSTRKISWRVGQPFSGFISVFEIGVRHPLLRKSRDVLRKEQGCRRGNKKTADWARIGCQLPAL
jgi:hypothetical protein